MGVNSATGAAHWYGITNQGEADDFVVTWPDAQTMRAHYAWIQNGKPMQENVVFRFTGQHSMSFRSVATTHRGQEMSTFSGSRVR